MLGMYSDPAIHDVIAVCNALQPGATVTRPQLKHDFVMLSQHVMHYNQVPQ